MRVISASQVSSTTTDAGGHFVFLSLQPDTYTLSIDKADYEPLTEAGITIFADQQQTLSFTMRPALQKIAQVTSTAAGALVRAGTTSDVYSVNSSTAAAVTGLGGGGGLDNAYSAIATMPGAYVPVGQAGWYQSVYIRGGDYDQVGYEVDGVPVNRSFDNYPSNTASSLGQQELQVYTGAAPADAQGQGIAGYINQVIKTGTYPGYSNSDIAVGFPSFYHKLNVEAGGASANRLFSYYVGLGGYNFTQRAYDQFNGASATNSYGAILGGCPATPISDPACYSGGAYLSGSPGGVQTPGFVLAPFYTDNINSYITDRDSVVNFHFGIPHKHDGGRDDIQLLYQTSQIAQYYANSQNDYAYGLSQLGITTPLTFLNGNLYTGSLNTAVDPATAASKIITYSFPGQDGQATIPLGMNDSTSIGDAIIKLQYQKNFSSSAYMRIYGYTDYSNWFNNGPLSMAYVFEEGLPQFDQLPDYVVSSHTRGLSGVFADQLSSSNLLQFQTSFTTATSERANSYTTFDSPGMQFATLVSSGAPDSGICYTYTGAQTGCSSVVAVNPYVNPYSSAAGPAYTPPAYITLGSEAGGVACGSTVQSAIGPVVATNDCIPATALPASCGGAPCEWLATENGYNGEYNAVTPRFWSGSLVDTFDPTDRLHLNVGVRYDNYAFIPNGSQTPASQFWFNAWNNSMCYNKAAPGSPIVPLSSVTSASNASNGGCTTLGPSYVQAYLSNTPSASSFPVWQPRVGLTYTLSPRDVLRASYGRYDQAPNTAFEEYDTLQQDLPDYLGPTFFAYGRTSPSYPIAPEVSNNWDLSWEHQFKGTDWSMKVTPFYRTTQDQIEQFYLNVTAGFVSGLNIGSQTNRGFEFDLQKGDFTRNGLSGMLAFTYTNAYVNYANLSTGSSVLTDINNNIQTFNAYTSACANGTAAKSLCGSTATGVAAAPCYAPIPAGAPAGTLGTPLTTCTAGDVANPYWNMAPQGLFSTSGSYWPYDLFPAGPGAGSYSSFVTPYVATLVLNYKHDKFAITPAMQFSAGQRYGYPLSEVGYDPSNCGAPTAVPITSAWYATAGGAGSAANPATCGSTIDIPNVATGHFDGIGAFVNPTRFTLSAQLSYDVSPKITAVLTMANLVDACLGGTTAAWTQNVAAVPGYKVCGYGTTSLTENGYPPGNVNAISASGAQEAQALGAYAYTPDNFSLPFNAYLDFRIKL